MSELKNLKPKQQLAFNDGLWFGMGFWTAATVFAMVVLPLLSCAAAVAFMTIGVSLADALN